MEWTPATLDAALADQPASPRDTGRIMQVCVRPGVDGRAFPAAVEFCPKRGVIGDRWEHRTWIHLADGSPDPRVQVALMEYRILMFLQTVTGCDHHPGDTLIVDRDLSAQALPPGARLRVGDDAVIEVSDVENDGCAKFARHYGADVLAWIRLPANRERRLRGLFARIVARGTVRPGDRVTLVA